ncbi:hypothetical protein B0T26DRAFT_461556 [Lasiosphaeria miniovina]|uniref:Uncharacterized protein n=1 Tax=Lasiosphaeria miniovina TaxID=1954250 RepID=A0AA40DNQ3_9PEZI|nr:uncharacterized protein B0T26DRAFT_461556 [Lasiosphaeria miniovina]KAK0706578.1 hypothetical protein B0T26DRAFT_461556 [Lasiosphaeria miniovina]
MSYNRSIDAYGRRPSGDDRRPPDYRNRSDRPDRLDRRRESYRVDDRPSAWEPDGSPRESGDPTSLPPPHLPPKLPATYVAKIDTSASRLRPDHGAKSSSPMTQSPVQAEGGSPVRTITDIFKELTTLVVEEVRLSSDREKLDSILAQRRIEHQRTMSKHTEFPSIPELQSRFRLRDKQQRDEVDVDLRKTWEQKERLLEKLSSRVLHALREGHVGETKATPKDPQIESRNNEFARELESLKTTLNDREEKANKAKEELQAQIQSLKQQHQQELENFKSEITQSFQSEMQKIRSDAQAQTETIKLLLSEQLKFDKHLQETKIPDTAPIVAEISALRQKYESSNNSLSRRVGELDGRLSQRQQEDQNLQNAVSSFQRQLEEQNQILSNQQNKLDNVDFAVLDTVAETFSFQWPELQGHVGQLQADIGNITKAIRTFSLKPDLPPALAPAPAPALGLSDQAQFMNKVKTFQDEMMARIGGMIDDQRNVTEGYDLRIKVLEKAMAPVLTAPEIDSLKAEANRLAKEIKVIFDRLEEANRAVKRVTEDSTETTKFLTHQITVLDSQYSNLSTKALAEHIIRQLEHVYSTPSQMMADIGSLSKQVQEIDVGGIKAKLLKIEKDQEKLATDLTGLAGSVKTKSDSQQNGGSKEWGRQVEDLARQGHKRRRVDSSANGAVIYASDDG